MQLKLPLGKFGMCIQHKNKCRMHRTSVKLRLEHSFNHHPDLERINLDSFNNRSLQRNRKYHRMPLQMQQQLSPGKFCLCIQHKNSNLHRTSVKRAVEQRFNHNPKLERLFLYSINNWSFQHDFKHI